MNSKTKNIVVFSSCPELWGGSEELWSQSVEILAKRGYKVHIFKLSVDFGHPQIKRLIALGSKITDLNEYLPSIMRRVWNRFLPHNPYRTLPFYIKRVLAKQVKSLQPELFIISQGANFDGLPFVQLCDLESIPYVIISQKAIKYLYPNDWARKFMKEMWQNSKRNYFVSHDNLKITQDQFGLKLENSEVVHNPFLTKVDEPLKWNFPDDDTIRIACVGRYYILDKGQDILLNVLAEEKWRRRNVQVSFYGRGVNEDGLKDLANYHGLDNVTFRGHTSDVLSIWQEHQALVLPARNEGLPLVVVEAMMCGRIPIVTDVGGNTEVVEDNVNGFVAGCADENSFDEALERAWERRNEWHEIGKLGAQHVRKFVSEDPAEVFAGKLEEIINTQADKQPENK
ncbi:MAG: glycosyltransferase family 4 protein [Acidobacteria bacterium]|nr:glycosyltransferase family 4 protein [Acidobacteriota bacterium]